MIDPIRAASIRALYTQMRNTLPAVLFILAYMIGATAPFNSWKLIAGWTAVILVMQVFREDLRRRFMAANPPDDKLESWAMKFVIQQGIAAVAWGSSMFLFAHPEDSITVALTLCCLYSVAAGAVPAQAYTPVSFYTLVAVLFAIVMVRLGMTGDFQYILLGLASCLFGVAMAGYCRIQFRIVQDTLRIRFENEDLVSALKTEKQEAEAARREAEDAHRQAETASIAKSQFLAAASHDLRQPLYALSLFSASLDDLKLNEEGKSVVSRIQDNVAIMESLFNGLLDVSRLEAGTIVAKPEPFSIDELFDRISQVFWPMAFSAGIDLRLRSDGEWVNSDPALVEQILSNLVSNALRATKAGGILVAARKRGGQLRIEVWDTGAGIAPEDQQRIFNEFVQIGNPERDRRKGLGLGLAIVKRAAALLGAPVDLASRPGRGSRFAFTLPQATPNHPARVQSSPPLPRQRQEVRTDLRVLFIDDDVSVRSGLESLLARWGQAADIVSSADQALDLVRAGARYDLVLSDYRLAGPIDGIALIEQLRGLHQEAPPKVFIVTGDLDASLIALAASSSIPVLHKPLKAADLKSILSGAQDAFA